VISLDRPEDIRKSMEGSMKEYGDSLKDDLEANKI
jgi:hypothetical protein